MPLIGSLIMLFLYQLYLKDDNTGLGIAQIHAELEYINTFLMRPFHVLIRVVGATITLIFGFSAGRFGPIIHLGTAVGSNMKYAFKMKPDRIRMLIGCGAASAISAVFGMPLFGSVFILEILYKKKFEKLYAPIVVSSVTAFLLGNFINHGSVIHSPIIKDVFYNSSQIWLFVVLGIVIGVASVSYVLSIEKFIKYFKRIQYRKDIFSTAYESIIRDLYK